MNRQRTVLYCIQYKKSEVGRTVLYYSIMYRDDFVAITYVHNNTCICLMMTSVFGVVASLAVLSDLVGYVGRTVSYVPSALASY